jgi:hypothetical protein
MQDIYGKLDFPVSGYEELTKLIKQREADLANALKESQRLLRERNAAWEELRQAGLRPKWPRG